MVEQTKILRVFQLIARLRQPFGVTKQKFSEDFSISERTFERYLNLIEEIGYTIEREPPCYFIKKVDRSGLYDDSIVFNSQEASLIRDCILGQQMDKPLAQDIIKKIYMLTDLDDIAANLSHHYTATVINLISNAIKAQKQVVLKGYHSAKSETQRDRVVEPIKFFNNYRYLLAFEPESMQVKQFKTDRIDKAEENGKGFKYQKYHKKNNVDLFGMSGQEPIKVKLALNKRAYYLLLEEYPEAEQSCTKDKDNGFLFKGKVYSFEGIGRFILGLPGQIEVIEPQELKEFVKKKIKEYIL
ncbi:MAG: WYL domain-containing protein [Bacteroidales bacterium]|nr:WYL domain-containing protein [Bacteroidales bacterium]